MKRLLFYVLIAATAWYGWKHYGSLRTGGENQATVVNQSAHALERLRLKAGGETVVIERLEVGASDTRPFRGGVDATFEMVWEYNGLMGTMRWSGGAITTGPLKMHHTFLVGDNGSVVWNSEVLAAKK